MRKLILLSGLLLVGCGINPGKNPEPVDITGKVTVMGKPGTDMSLNLQPTGTGTQAVFPVVGGEFKGKATPGRYTWYLSEGRNPASFAAVPTKYRTGAMDRQVDVAGGTPLDIKVE